MKQKTFILSKKKSFTAFAISVACFRSESEIRAHYPKSDLLT